MDYVKEWARWLYWAMMVLVVFALLPVLFVFFWVWELVDKRGSRAFWNDVYEPYEGVI